MPPEPASRVRNVPDATFSGGAEAPGDSLGSLQVIRATWNGAVLAEADKTVVVEGHDLRGATA
jgi:uncharacterized protein (DUF427 family)